VDISNPGGLKVFQSGYKKKTQYTKPRFSTAEDKVRVYLFAYIAKIKIKLVLTVSTSHTSKRVVFVL
jgi:hypothetical protein